MKKNIALLLFTMLFLTSCKKDTIVLKENGEFKRLKTKTVGNTTYNYFYDSNGKLKLTMINTKALASGAPETNEAETYTYNANGRMIQSASPSYTNIYAYDSSDHLTQHTRIDENGARDSVTFTVTDGLTTGTWGDVKYYYTNKLNYYIRKSQYLFNGAPDTSMSTIVYTYNSTPDLSSMSLLNSYNMLTLADFDTNGFEYGYYELAAYNYDNFGGPAKYRYSYTLTRTYDDDNYPITVSQASEGSSSADVIIKYTYY